MAIKGKKKSQQRGSQARRRPAAAPRPVLGTRGRVPWHRTAGGRVAVAVGATLVGVAIVAVAASIRSDNAEVERRADELDRYTGEIKAVLQTLNPPVADMLAIPPEAAAITTDLKTESKKWKQELGRASTETTAVVAPPGVENVTQLIVQAIAIYTSAADTFALVPKAEGKLQQDLLVRALAQRDQGSLIFQSAVTLLDERRTELDMSTSQLQPPGAGPPPSTTPPQTSVTITPPPAEDGAGDGGGKGSRGGGGKKDGDRSGRRKSGSDGKGN